MKRDKINETEMYLKWKLKRYYNSFSSVHCESKFTYYVKKIKNFIMKPHKNINYTKYLNYKKYISSLVM